MFFWGLKINGSGIVRRDKIELSLVVVFGLGFIVYDKIIIFNSFFVYRF